MTGNAALEVTAEDSQPFEQSVTSTLDGTPGLAAAVPVLEGKAAVYAQGSSQRDASEEGIDVQVLGIDPKRHEAVNDYKIVSGEKFTSADGAILSTSLAEQLGAKVGDQIGIYSQRLNKQAEPVVGIFKPQTATAVSNLSVMLLPLEQAQQRLLKVRRSDSRERVTKILLVLEDGANESAVQDAVATKVGAGLTVHRPSTRNQMADETGLGVRQATNMALAFALLVAVFVIMNTFLMNVSERSKQLAILRAIGSTRWQIAWLIGREAVMIGLVGAVGGMALGVPLARLLIRGMEGLMHTTMPEIELTWKPFALAGGVGIGIAAVGALAPVIRSFRITPREGIQGIAGDRAAGSIGWTTPAAILFLAAAAGLYYISLKGWVPMIFGLFASLSALLGIVLLVPRTLGVLTKLTSSLVPRWLRVETVLAQRQLLRNPGRSTLTIGVLFIAASTGVGLANTILDNVNTIHDWYHKTVVGDFFVSISQLGTTPGQAASLPDEVGEEVRGIPGVTALDPVSWVNRTAHGQSVVLIVRGYTSDDYVNFDTNDLDNATLYQRLWAGEVVIGSVFAQRAHLKRGDHVTLTTQEGETRSLPIAAVTDEYRSGGLVIFMQRKTAHDVLGIEDIHEYVIRADPAMRDEVKAALRKVCDQHGMTLVSLIDITSMIDGMINGVLGGLWVLLVLGFVVASLGLANTLAMNVLEQSRELAMLRVVAMTRGQVRKLIFAQAVLMGAVSLLPALAAGVGVAYMINLMTMPVTGHAIRFGVHPLMIVSVFAAAYVIVVAVAWLPAERAARLSTSSCLHYE
jgi:putative ABC transport system permease protein